MSKSKFLTPPVGIGYVKSLSANKVSDLDNAYALSAVSCRVVASEDFPSSIASV